MGKRERNTRLCRGKVRNLPRGIDLFHFQCLPERLHGAHATLRLHCYANYAPKHTIPPPPKNWGGGYGSNLLK